MMKKIFLLLISTIIINQIYATDFYYTIGQEAINQNQTTEDVGTLIAEDTTDTDSLINRLIEVFRLDNFTNNSDSAAINYISFIINLALWLGAFIALIILLYGFYMMFFSAQEEGFEKAKKTLIGASIALFIIGLSRFIASFIFSLYSTIQ